MRRTVRGTSRVVEEAARRLRREPTRAEAVLWRALRKEGISGLRFRRQHPLGRFVLDFCCPSHRLAVEVDGEVHGAQRERDEARTAVLEAFGYRVLRFSNQQVLTDLAGVVRAIAAAATSLATTSDGRNPPPGVLGEGGEPTRAGGGVPSGA